MSDAVKCGICNYVYWVSWRENWGTCPNCETNNDFSEKHATLVDSKHVFTFMSNVPQRRKIDE